MNLHPCSLSITTQLGIPSAIFLLTTSPNDHGITEFAIAPQVPCGFHQATALELLGSGLPAGWAGAETASDSPGIIKRQFRHHRLYRLLAHCDRS